ncbi:MAG: hypothetical protein AAB848_00495 [Patescibacteria group bacterium]
MPKILISIQEAADLSKKSIQTIRRAIKSKKLEFKKSKTPQGFNYLIYKESLCEVYGLNLDSQTQKEVKPPKSDFLSSISKNAKNIPIEADDFKGFVKTLENLLVQHNEERQNFLRLLNTMQEKIFVLENQLNLLKAPAEKKWYQVWK